MLARGACAEQLVDPLAAPPLGDAGDLEAERHVLGDRPPREQRVALEHDAAIGPRSDDEGAVDPHLAGRRLVEPGDDVEQRRLAAARGAEQAHELAVGDLHRAPSRAPTSSRPPPNVRLTRSTTRLMAGPTARRASAARGGEVTDEADHAEHDQQGEHVS